MKTLHSVIRSVIFLVWAILGVGFVLAFALLDVLELPQKIASAPTAIAALIREWPWVLGLAVFGAFLFSIWSFWNIKALVSVIRSYEARLGEAQATERRLQDSLQGMTDRLKDPIKREIEDHIRQMFNRLEQEAMANIAHRGNAWEISSNQLHKKFDEISREIKNSLELQGCVNSLFARVHRLEGKFSGDS